MIKLTDIIQELGVPTNIYAQGSKQTPDDEFIKTGMRMSKPTVDPETGASSSTVEYSPKLSEDVVGTLPGTELRFSSILTDIFMDQFKRYVSLILGLI